MTTKTLEGIERELADLERQLETRAPARREAIEQRIRRVTRHRNRLLMQEHRRIERRLWDIAEALGEGFPSLHVRRP